MAERTFADVALQVQPEVPGCPQATVVQQVRRTLIRVCERTLAWRYQVPVYNLLPGVSEYLFATPVNTDVHAIFEVLVNNYPLKRLTLEQAIRQFPEWADLYSGENPTSVWVPNPAFGNDEYNESVFGAGSEFALTEAALADGSTPQAVCQLTPDKYIVLPLPDADKVYSVRMFVALKPKRSAVSIDTVIMDELEEVTIHGVLQHLLMIPGNWQDLDRAAYHAKQYAFMLSERRARANVGNVRGTLTVQMQPFGA